MAPGLPSSILAKVLTEAFSSPSIFPFINAAICLAVNSISLDVCKIGFAKIVKFI